MRLTTAECGSSIRLALMLDYILIRMIFFGKEDYICSQIHLSLFFILSVNLIRRIGGISDTRDKMMNSLLYHKSLRFFRCSSMLSVSFHFGFTLHSIGAILFYFFSLYFTLICCLTFRRY